MRIYDEYVNYMENERKSKTTIKGYIDSMRIVSRILFNKEFKELTPNDFESITEVSIVDLKHKLYNQGNKSTTVALRLNALLSIYKFLIKLKLLDKKYDLREEIKEEKGDLKKDAEVIKEELTEKDIQQIFNTIKNIESPFKLRRQLIFHLMTNYGLRREEICNLRILDFDFERNEMYVFGKGKTNRPIHIKEQTKDIIRYYLEERNEKLTYSNSEYLIVSRKGDRLTPSGLSQDFKRVIRELETTKRIHPHALRSFFATLLYKNGEDLLKIKTALRHSSINTTQRYIRNQNDTLIDTIENSTVDINII